MASVDDFVNSLHRNTKQLPPSFVDLVDLLLHLRSIAAIDDDDRKRLTVAIIRNEVFSDFEDPSLDSELGSKTR